jgi:hypothetical protein
MGRMNMAKVIAGGLLAGLIINLSEFVLNTYVVAAEMERALKAMQRPMPGGQAIAVFTALGFLLGIATIWLYAAIRPRYGAGPRTASMAALAVWFFAYLYPSVFMIAMDMFPTGMTALALVWGLVEILVASLAGGWVYSER